MLALLAEMRCTEPQGENCLVLNVWEPTWSTSTTRPVMVSLHGGGHTIGSGSMPVFDGASLASRHDVVVVSVNHRLGALGYLYLADVLGDDGGLSANVGELDLVTSLRWVRANAEAFGGDQSNVTIFGQSGGGSKVSTLLAMPAAAGLFHRAIVQSGPKLQALSPDEATANTRALLDTVGLATNPRGLYDVPTAEIVAAQVRVMGGPLGAGSRTFAPVIDDHTLPRHPFDPDAPSVSASVPLLIGTTKDEATLFTHPNEALDTLDPEDAVSAITPLIGERASALYDIYRATRPDVSPAGLVTAIMTDRFRVASIRMAERKAAGHAAPVWMYRFDYATDVEGGALGAPHAVDIAYTFGNPDASASADPAPNATPSPPPSTMSGPRSPATDLRTPPPSPHGRHTTINTAQPCCSTSTPTPLTTPTRSIASPGRTSQSAHINDRIVRLGRQPALRRPRKECTCLLWGRWLRQGGQQRSPGAPASTRTHG